MFTSEPTLIERHIPGAHPIKVGDASSRHPPTAAPDFAQTITDCIGRSDLVLLSGGGFFSDEFATHALALLETLAIAQQRDIPTAIISPGFEPVKNVEVIVDAWTRAEITGETFRAAANKLIATHHPFWGRLIGIVGSIRSDGMATTDISSDIASKNTGY